VTQYSIQEGVVGLYYTRL